LYSKQAAYRRFLIFKDFYEAKRPVVVCEGKTDNTYLRHALKSLGPAYPKLASVSASNKVELKIRILRTLGSCVGRVLDLGHGFSSLNGLIKEYVKELKRFKAPGMEHPVILLADNDDGGDAVVKVIKGITKSAFSNADPFVHVMGNLYLVLTPLPAGKTKSEIEDFFDDNVKNLKLGGKKFNPNDKADSDLYFSKSILAEYVRDNAGRIDFSGFSPVFDRITQVLEDYEVLLASQATTQGAAAGVP